MLTNFHLQVQCVLLVCRGRCCRRRWRRYVFMSPTDVELSIWLSQTPFSCVEIFLSLLPMWARETNLLLYFIFIVRCCCTVVCWSFPLNFYFGAVCMLALSCRAVHWEINYSILSFSHTLVYVCYNNNTEILLFTIRSIIYVSVILVVSRCYHSKFVGFLV